MRTVMLRGLIGMIVLSLCLVNGVRAEEQKGVRALEVRNNKAISSATILSKIKTKPGDLFSQEVINEDIKRLYALGFFTDVAVSYEPFEDGIKVIIAVTEKPLVGEITFVGNKRIRAERLRKLMKSMTGELLDRAQLSNDMKGIKDFYQKKGFFNVVVDYKTYIDEATNKANIVVNISEEQRTKVARITFVGNDSMAADELKRLMSTRRAWFFSSGSYSKEDFEDDLERIKLHYRTQGFLDAEVSSETSFAKEGRLMYITITIDEGRRYYVNTIAITGNRVFPTSELQKAIALTPGHPYSDEFLHEDLIALQEFYYDRGYMHVEIEPDTVLDQATQNVNVAFAVSEGEVVYVGKVKISGNIKTKDIVIRRELRAYPGEKFEGSKIKKSKKRLYNLGFFEDISFDTQPTDRQNVMDLAVDVKETKTGEFSFGGGYSSVDKLLGFVEIRQKNFDIMNFPTFTGDGQELVLRTMMGTVRKDYELSWTEPWILDYPLSFGFDLYRRAHDREGSVGYGYQEVRQGGDLRLGKEFTDELRGDLMWKLENVDISDVPDDSADDLKQETGENRLNVTSFTLTYDKRDDIFNPTKGFLLMNTIENASKMLSGNKEFLKYIGSYAVYFNPRRDHVMEITLRAGVVDAYGSSDKVPIYERFFAGGSSTVRGYKERGIGPKDGPSGVAVGGEAMALMSAEYTVPLFKNVIKGAVFYDIGNVWEKVGSFGSGGFKHGVGTGLRVNTPIGPVRVDYGIPLTDIPDESKKGRFYFSMSRGF